MSCSGKELMDESAGHEWVEKRLYMLAGNEYQEGNELPRHEWWVPVRYCDRCGLLQVSFEKRGELR